MKVLAIFIIFSLVFSSQSAFAQAPDTLWTKTYDFGQHVEGNYIQKTSDNGFIIAGCIDFSAGFIKTDQFGDTMWTKTLMNGEVFLSVEQTIDEGFIATGYCNSAQLYRDLYLVKTDLVGDTLWTKSYSIFEFNYGYSVKQTSDSGFIITGYTTHPTPNENHAVLLIKTDTYGDTAWTKVLFAPVSGSDAEGNSVCQTNDGGYIISGGYWDPYLWMAYMWLIKTDEFGDTLWTKIIDGDGFGRCVQQTTDGGYVVVGTNYGAYLIKTDEHGDSLWSYSTGRPARGQIWGNHVQETNDEGFIIAASGFVSEGYMHSYWGVAIKVDGLGNEIWETNLDGCMDCRCVQQTNDGGYILIGNFGGYEWENSSWIDNKTRLIKLALDPVKIDSKKDLISLSYSLSQNYPNPFNPTTFISWQLPVGSSVKLTVYNITGQKVATLIDNRQLAGSHSIEWDASGLASGVYIYRLEAGQFVQSRKMMLLK